MPVQPVPGLGRAPRLPRTSPRGLQGLNSWLSPLLGCFALLLLSACTPTRVTLIAQPLAMESIERVYVVAGAESVLAEKLGAEKTSREVFDFTQTLGLEGTQEAGALAFVEVRKLSGEERSEAQAQAAMIGGKAPASNRWRVAKPSGSKWLRTKFDLLGDSIIVELTKSGFKYNEEMSLAVIVGARDDRGIWKHYRTRIPTAALTPGGFLFITSGKKLTFNLKADDKPERVLDLSLIHI